MKFLILLLMLSGTCFAQDHTLEDRVSNLEQSLLDIPNYIEEHCTLALDYAGTSSMGCFDSVISGVRTDIRMYGSSFYVTNWLDCKRYRLICR